MIEAASSLRSAVVSCDTEFNPDRRIYIHRSGGVRNVSNFEEIKGVIEAYGFDIVDFETMSISDQIVTMYGAKHVVGEHGAGLINILFMKPGGTVLEIFNSGCAQPAFWSVASARRLNFGYIVGSSDNGDDWNSSYAVNPERLRNAIEAQISVA